MKCFDAKIDAIMDMLRDKPDQDVDTSEMVDWSDRATSSSSSMTVTSQDANTNEEGDEDVEGEEEDAVGKMKTIEVKKPGPSLMRRGSIAKLIHTVIEMKINEDDQVGIKSDSS